MSDKTKPTSILRLPEVIERTGIPRSSIYSAIKEGEFPKPIQLGARRIGFIESEVEKWLEERIQVSRGIT